MYLDGRTPSIPWVKIPFELRKNGMPSRAAWGPSTRRTMFDEDRIPEMMLELLVGPVGSEPTKWISCRVRWGPPANSPRSTF